MSVADGLLGIFLAGIVGALVACGFSVLADIFDR